jgi:hypothetical protein
LGEFARGVTTVRAKDHHIFLVRGFSPRKVHLQGRYDARNAGNRASQLVGGRIQI